ncbi:MAG: putative DNA-binding domain-containing protein [Thiolinea sp.]
MNNKPVSPFAADQIAMSAQIYTGEGAGGSETNTLTGWRCSKRIPEEVALGIYQQNLHGGVAQHLQTHYPVMYAYIGVRAYQMICAEYLKASPPEQAIFTVYAAHFPGFLLAYGEQHPQQFIWAVAAQLAQIDFFHHNTFRENQRIVVDEHYYQLWIRIRSLIDNAEEIDAGGLYRRTELHPEHYQQQAGKMVELVTFLDNGELYFRV